MANHAGLLLLRVGAAGLLLIGHGLEKLAALFAGATDFPDPLHVGPRMSLLLAVLTEVGAASSVLFGLATRAAAGAVALTMAIAALVVNHGAPWADIELGLIFGVPFAALVLTGGGDWSIDALVRRRRRRA